MMMSLDEYNIYGKNELNKLYDSLIDKSFDESISYDDKLKVFDLYNKITSLSSNKFRIYPLLKSFVDEQKENAYIEDITKIEQWYYNHVIYNSNLSSRNTFESLFNNLAHYIKLYFELNSTIAKMSIDTGMSETEVFQYAASELIRNIVRVSHEQFIRMNGGLDTDDFT